MSIGFIGLGSLGEPMAQRVIAAGHSLTVWNRTAAKAERLAAAGARVASSPAALAATCDAVCICVTDAEALDEIVFGANGVTASSTTLRYLVDHSTISPKATLGFAGRLAAGSGATWLDAPVSGGRAGAQRGSLAAFLGGPVEAVEAVRPIVECFASNISHMGPTGAGQAAKACNQLIGFLSIAAAAEAISLASSLGLDPTKLPAAFAGGFGGTPVLAAWGEALRKGDLSGPPRHVEALHSFLTGRTEWPEYEGSGPQNLVKDLRIIQELARHSGAVLPLTEQMKTIFDLVSLHKPTSRMGKPISQTYLADLSA